MSLFFETIFLQNGTIRNLSYHNARMNRTRKLCLNQDRPLDLASLDLPYQDDPLRVKIVYGKEFVEMMHFPILPRKFESFKIIHADLSYPFKALDRTPLDKLVAQKGSCDEILIVDSEGSLKDFSIANIALFDGQKWITPRHPLLQGTMRASLLNNQLLLEKDVKIEQLKTFTKIAMLNAILGFHQISRFHIEE